MKLLQNKRVLVTGGARGLGRAFCHRFAVEGADVAFNYSTDEEGAKTTTELIESNSARAMSFRVSVTDAAQLDRMAKQIEQTWGAIDVLVNNAGISQALPVALMEESDWDSVLDVNIKGQFLSCRAVLKGMIKRRQGCILNVGSIAGLRLLEAPVHYSASKAAVKGFTEALSKEMGRYNIRVNCLAPGLLEEGVGQNLPEHRLREYLKHVALHRMGTLEEVARFAAFLVSDRNSYMTGATIIMDGGL